MGQEQYYVIYDDDEDVSCDIASPVAIIRFKGYIYGDQIDKLLQEYQKGKDPVFWEQHNIEDMVIRQMNSESLYKFTKWLGEKHKLACEIEDYARCSIRLPTIIQ